MTPTFDALADAQRWLLGDAASIAVDRSSVAVVGGWCSVFNNHRDEGLHHPGTKDVDLLFEDGASEGELAAVVDGLLRAGYIVSAKHGFQLVRVLSVGRRELAFSVDLLHPNPNRVSRVGDMFSKHVDLGIDLTPGVGAEQWTVSIGTPLLDEVFRHDLLVEHELPSGESTARFLDDAGLIVSKAAAAQGPKRQRDSFDLFLAVAQPMTDVSHVGRRLRSVTESSRPVRDALSGLRDWLKSEPGEFDFNERVNEQIEILEARGVPNQKRHLRTLTEGDQPSTLLINLLDTVLGT